MDGSDYMPAAQQIPGSRFSLSFGKRVLVFGSGGQVGDAGQHLSSLLDSLGHLSVIPSARPGVSSSSLLRQWRAAEGNANSISLGIVAWAGTGTDALGQILDAGLQGGPMPGAMVVIGYDGTLAATLAEPNAKSAQFRPATWPQNRSVSAPVEWPPILFVLPTDSPHHAGCAKACRRMRAVGVSAAFEIIDAQSEREMVELAAELDRFFDSHLVTDFPKVF